MFNRLISPAKAQTATRQVISEGGEEFHAAIAREHVTIMASFLAQLIFHP